MIVCENCKDPNLDDYLYPQKCDVCGREYLVCFYCLVIYTICKSCIRDSSIDNILNDYEL